MACKAGREVSKNFLFIAVAVSLDEYTFTKPLNERRVASKYARTANGSFNMRIAILR